MSEKRRNLKKASTPNSEKEAKRGTLTFVIELNLLSKSFFIYSQMIKSFMDSVVTCASINVRIHGIVKDVAQLKAGFKYS